MDFTFTEEEEAIITVARRLFEERATPDHLTALETRATRFDDALWKELAEAGLLGIAVPEEFGGSGRGFLGVCVLLAQVGWSVAPVPAYATLVLGADPIALFGTPEQRKRYLPAVVAGTHRLTAGLMESSRSDPSAPATTARKDGAGWRLHGAKALVPAAQVADSVLVPAATGSGEVGLFLLDTAAAGVEVKPIATTNGEPHADLLIDGARVLDENRLSGPGRGVEMVRTLYARALVGVCALQLGVVERALRIAADYTAGREQFGRPIGSFQAVQQRMADAFIDVEAIRWTTWYAAWLLEMNRPASREASIAKFWAAEAGARVAATAQQVHGGIGIDTSYRLFRYFLWAKQNELALGSASQHLARLGVAYAEGNHR